MTHVQLLLDSARYAYEHKAFQKAYDYYNNASTFPGGMDDKENFNAAVVFSKIAREDKDDKYKSIALDFLDLLVLRSHLTRSQLFQESAFRILYKEPRWIRLNAAWK